jgi:hypothetical protein
VIYTYTVVDNRRDLAVAGETFVRKQTGRRGGSTSGASSRGRGVASEQNQNTSTTRKQSTSRGSTSTNSFIKPVKLNIRR